MVAEIQNALVTILRGTTVTAYGDVADNRQPILPGIPASLLETAQTVLDPATQTPMTIRAVTCYVPAWTGVLNSDQILDQTTGDVYAITEVVRPPTLTGAPVDLKLILRRISAAGP